jgi:putative lipoprotein
MVFACPDGPAFSVRFSADSVTVDLGVREARLPRVISASGVRFAGDDLVVWTKGSEALLEVGGLRYEACPGQLAEGRDDEARLRGVDFLGLGQEPGWRLDLDREGWIRVILDYGESRLLTPVPEPARTTDGTLRYEATTEAHELTVEIREQSCQDVMSGEAFTHTVSVEVDGRIMTGCGRFL